MTESSTPIPTATMKAVSPDGFETSFTFGAVRVDELRQAVEKAGRALLKAGWTPAPAEVLAAALATAGGNGHGTGNGNGPVAEQAPICPYHKSPMQRRSKDGRSWWSCSHKIEGTHEWCQYRPKK